MMRAQIVAAARAWIGTPYRHQASSLGAGCDCLGLVRGVWRTVLGDEPESPLPYSPDWFEREGAETLRDAARRWLIEKPVTIQRAGDVILFRMAPDSLAKHCAILTSEQSIIHAYWGRAVVESRLAPWWRARTAHIFSFPGAE